MAAPTPDRIEYGVKTESRLQKTIKSIKKDRWLYLLILPGVVYYLIFRYGPMWGVLIAFKDYNGFLGFWKSPWVGFVHFQRLFTEPTFWMLLRNTIMLALYNLVLYFPVPIIMALMLNEIVSVRYRRAVQTFIYIPHFVSWVVAVGIFYILFTPEGGLVNEVIKRMGGGTINLLWSERALRPFYTAQVIWKEAGWGTIIFLAALAGIDTEMYEAASIDGASRWQRMLYITLPAIRSTIVILFILRLGNFLDTGFEHIFNLRNALNRGAAEVFDTYVYDNGIINGFYSFSTAIGLFKSAVGLIMVYFANKVAKRIGEEGIF
ncbi:MAG: ABC transporter permease [Bacteroidota bacterium]